MRKHTLVGHTVDGYACSMGTAPNVDLVPVGDYLAGELVSPIKHEYVGGVVYAMAGARNLHNAIKGNAFANLHVRLRGRSCRPFDSDTKVRIRLPAQVRFYYPDVSVVCHPNPPTDSYQDEPVVIVEVLSRKTRRTDEGEKKDAYLSVPSVAVYLLVEQEVALVIAHRRTDRGFVREVYTGTSAVIPLPEIGTELPLSEIYDSVELVPEDDEL
jgi:Uma2 family endonuclease